MLELDITVEDPVWDAVLAVICAVLNYATSSVLYTVCGATVMQLIQADSYSILWSSRVSAVGGVILAIPWYLLAIAVNHILPSDKNRAGIMAWIGTTAELVLHAASSTGSAALGTKILMTSSAAETIKQGVRESAIAGGVGAIVWMAAMPTFLTAISILSVGGFTGVCCGLEVEVKKRCEDDSSSNGVPSLHHDRSNEPGSSVWGGDIR